MRSRPTKGPPPLAHARPTLGDRITRSKIPVNGSLHPRDNAPLSAGVLLGILAAVLTATQDLPLWFSAVVFVVIAAVLVAVQYFTVPASDLLDTDGPVKRHAGGELGHRDR